eukprot:jgi/Mesen1/5354/ME000267S04502
MAGMGLAIASAGGIGVSSEEGSLSLREHVEEEARDLAGEAFTRFMDSLYDRLSALVESPAVIDNLGAVHAIDDLIDISLGENATKISRFASYLRHIFEHKTDADTLVAASAALGHLARAGGALTADVVEFQVKQALDWLQGERMEPRRFAAVLILKEMAENAPTVFNVHVPTFIDAIWFPLRDQKLVVRERAVDALRACLCVIEERETRWRVQWYFRMFEETQKGLARNASVECIHGSLLAVGELLRNTREFMMARFTEVANVVLKYRDHRDKLVRRSITGLLPRIAHFLRERFVTSYLKICMDHLLGVMRTPGERDTGFWALGEMAGAVGGALRPYLPAITMLLRDAIAPRRGRPSGEALACLGSLAHAVGPDMTDHVRALLDPCFASGLSSTLVTSLSQITSRLPVLLPPIQARLLEMLSSHLVKKAYRQQASGAHSHSRAGSSASSPSPGHGHGHSLSLSHSSGGGSSSNHTGAGLVELTGAPLTQLALRTLSTFDFQGHEQELLEFGRDHIVRYLDDDDVATRREAALCCCRLLKHACVAAAAPPRGARSPAMLSAKKRRTLTEEVLEKLLVASVADADAGVRRAVLMSLRPDAGLDAYVAQADSLRAIFIAFNDEAFEVRELAITLAGRLATRNPAYVLPALRRHLVQLLVDLEHSTDSRQREESARLLGSLICACTHLVLPYIAPILKVLIGKLEEGIAGGGLGVGLAGGGGTSGVVSSVLATVGELSRVGGVALRPYVDKLMPLIVEALHDGGASEKREVAVVTLGQLVESTGHVVAPYTDFPQLLGILLRLLNGELAWSIRRAALQVLGILGALDPHIHKRNQQALQAPLNEPARADAGPHGHTHMQHGRSLEELPVDLFPPGGLSTTSEDYYPTVAIAALLRVLRDGTLSSYHHRVVNSLVYIFSSMKLACVPYLPKVLPDLFNVMRTCDDGLREYLFWSFATLVTTVRQHVRKWLPDMLSLVYEYWGTMLLSTSPRPSAASPILNLVEHLCRALNDEFRAYLPEILRRCVAVITEAERSSEFARVPPVLHAFEVFGGSMDEHMHLLLPALVRLFKPGLSDAPLEIRKAALRTLARLLPTMQVTGHAAAIVHPLTRVLDGPNDEVRRDAVDALCALAAAQGSDFAIFVPSIRKLLLRHRLQHSKFESIATRVLRREPALVPEPLLIGFSSSGGSGAGSVGGGASAPAQPSLPASGIYTSHPGGGSSMHGGIAFDDSERNDGDNAAGDGRSLKVNEASLRKAWESSQRSTKEDWAEWMRHFSVELLKESPSPALRTCAPIAQLQPFVARELFAAGFVSCWAELSTGYQDQLVRSLEAAFASPNIPPEIVATLLNLAEFMEHDEKPLPVDIRTLGALAEKCHAFAKALHYKELEFESSPTTSAAVGILVYAQQHLAVELKESWYEELQRWEEALAAYERKASSFQSPHAALDATLGRMRCLAALARWEELSDLCREAWVAAELTARVELAPLGASAAWNMGEWDEMAEYVTVLGDGDDAHERGRMALMLPPPHASSSGPGVSSSDGSFFRAVLCVRRGQYLEATEYVERARKLLATQLAALVLESYDRAYGDMVRVQQLAELEEVIDYCQLAAGGPGTEARAALIRRMWQGRIRGAQRNVEVWQALLAVRSLVVPPDEDQHTWLKYASLCRKSSRVSQSRATLVKLLQYDPALARGVDEAVMPGVQRPAALFAYLKHMWSLGGDANRRTIFRQLQVLAGQMAAQQMASGEVYRDPSAPLPIGMPVPLLARIYRKLGQWHWNLQPSLSDSTIQDIVASLHAAKEAAPHWSRAWHQWALFNTAAMTHCAQQQQLQLQQTQQAYQHAAAAQRHLVAAVSGYFQSISLASTSPRHSDESLQDILRLLTLWFSHGAAVEVHAALQEGFARVSIDTWLQVIPQIIARIHSNTPAVRGLIQGLLVRIGRHHPQALMFPLLVACKSMSAARRTAAQHVLDNVRAHSPGLVDAAQLVGKELIRVAILWHESWHEALEEASRLYFGEHNIEGMLNTLQPLHENLNSKGPETHKEISFIQAWDLYYQVFKRINKQLPSLTTLELQAVSPALVDAHNLELAVPGTYRAGSPVVTIASFAPQLLVITSKQRPRRIFITGSDGAEYMFLLKGHEDLRQDERDLSIQRYAVVPLSPNSGLIGWVPNCDTLHQLIREYRDARKTAVNVEHRLMLQFAPDYDHLTLMAKVEVFEHALENTPGNDLAKVLWLKSRSSEVWLDRRTNYTRSLAVMSMVGYLLGLGDRHPSNLMLDRYSGKIIHIDFGDCFEASMNREKFPEKVPFRLTRMLIKAMEVSGMEGNFRFTCESVMQVLRSNRDSVMAMMEAFVHDPLINWRLFNITEVQQMPAIAPGRTVSMTGGEELAAFAKAADIPSPPQRGVRERELLQAVGQLGDAMEVLNERAVAVMTRMSNKLTGRDFHPAGAVPMPVGGGAALVGGLPQYPGERMDNVEPGLSVKTQVFKLIGQATSHENLCQSYIGWCPFW